MGDRDPGSRRADGAAESGRRVALDDQKFGAVAAQLGQGRRRDFADMLVRILAPRAAKVDRGISGQAMVARVERRMLAAEDEPRLEAARRQRLGNRCKLDGFGTGSDDQANR